MTDIRPEELTLANWDMGGEPSRWAYRNAGQLFSHVEVATAEPVAELELVEMESVGLFRLDTAAGPTLAESLARSPVDGLVVVHQGRIVYERYPRMDAGDRHLLMSVSKVFVSTLIIILERRGELNVAEPIDRLIPELAGSGWSGVPVIDILDMASGIACLEDEPGAYDDPHACFYQFEATLGWRPARQSEAASTYDLVRGLPRHRRCGEAYEYTSVNTFVLTWLIERLTGSAFHEALGREIWSRGGFEARAQLCRSASGAPASHGGISTTLRDLARFGMLFTPSRHRVFDDELVDDDHGILVHARCRPRLLQPGGFGDRVLRAFGSDLPHCASGQWNFVWPDGDRFKGGFGGQGLYVSGARDLVIAFVGTPAADGSVNGIRWICRPLAQALFEARTAP
ncbi:MAG: beta-lactamase family protein [Chloroflexota bacterium]|nr:beta-lactamase family protein [Chloroflexota bacterium]